MVEQWLRDFGILSVDPSSAADGGGTGSFGGGALPASAVLAGDVAGATDANTVEKIRGVTTPAPAADDDYEVLAYVHGSLAYQLLTPPFKVATKTGNYTLTADDMVILADATAGNITITLPPAASATHRVHFVKKTDGSANTVTLDGDGAETIDGEATQVINLQYNAIMVVSNGSAWFIV